MFGETLYRADCSTEFSEASFLLRGKKKEEQEENNNNPQENSG